MLVLVLVLVLVLRPHLPPPPVASLNVGSRPSKRRPTGGVETLRAIPWVFAWTQTRLNLTAWLGVGQALGALAAPADEAALRAMYRGWPWFTALIDVVDMVLAKTEERVAANYDRRLVPAGGAEAALGARLRGELRNAKAGILSLRGYERHQEENAMLLRGLKVRNPYVDPLNVIQAEALRRLREAHGGAVLENEEQAQLEDALAITINGIANGQKNTG